MVKSQPFSVVKYLLLSIAFFVIYFAAGKISLSFAIINGNASAVWLPTGIALAMLVIFGYRHWPSVFLGAFLVNLTAPTPYAISLGIALGNTLEAIITAVLVVKIAGGVKAFSSPSLSSKFALIVVLSTMVSATIGVMSLVIGHAAEWADYSAVWFTWWVGNLVGSFMVAPLAFSLLENTPRSFSKRPLESFLSLLGCVILGALIFTQFSPFAEFNYPIGYLYILPIIWIAIRLDRLTQSIALLLLSGIALYGTINGYGQFVHETPNLSLVFLQLFLATNAFAGIILSSVANRPAAR